MAENSKPTMRPRRKVAAGALTGAIVCVIVWLLKTFANLQVPTELSAALSTIVSFGVSYLTPPGKDETSITDADGNTRAALT
jgi:putative flippase GtrA